MQKKNTKTCHVPRPTRCCDFVATGVWLSDRYTLSILAGAHQEPLSLRFERPVGFPLRKGVEHRRRKVWGWVLFPHTSPLKHERKHQTSGFFSYMLVSISTGDSIQHFFCSGSSGIWRRSSLAADAFVIILFLSIYRMVGLLEGPRL